jgi:hypothetical protein
MIWASLTLNFILVKKKLFQDNRQKLFNDDQFA